MSLPIAFGILGFLFGVAVGAYLAMDLSEDDSEGQGRAILGTDPDS